MMARFQPADELDRELLRELERDRGRVKLTQPVEYRPAGEADLPVIEEILAYARKTLRRHGVDQWQGEYPDGTDVREDIRRGEGFVVTHGGEVAAYFALSPEPEESYAHIRDGKWTPGPDYCVLHRLAVAEKYRGGELARRALRCAEERARALGRRCVRTDTHKKNKAMKSLLTDGGYRYRGNLTIDAGEGHDGERQAYEKLLKERK